MLGSCVNQLYMLQVFNIITLLIKTLLSLSFASNLVMNSNDEKDPSTQPTNNSERDSGTTNQNNVLIIRLTSDLASMKCLFNISTIFCYNNKTIKIYYKKIFIISCMTKFAHLYK